MAKTTLTQERLRELLHYDPLTGIFTRLKTVASTARAGQRAGCPSKHGYMRIMIDFVSYRCNRLAVLYMTGLMPDGDVDHINGARADDRWSNLRVVTRSINLQNQRRPRSNNKSGFLGVHQKPDGRFIAQITTSTHENRYLGTYDIAHDAHAAYLIAKRESHEGCTI